jgi:hypothetical protein
VIKVALLGGHESKIIIRGPKESLLVISKDVHHDDVEGLLQLPSRVTLFRIKMTTIHVLQEKELFEVQSLERNCCLFC